MVCQNKNSSRCCKGKYVLRARDWLHQTGMLEGMRVIDQGQHLLNSSELVDYGPLLSVLWAKEASHGELIGVVGLS
jgi:hypothetical protein